MAMARLNEQRDQGGHAVNELLVQARQEALRENEKLKEQMRMGLEGCRAVLRAIWG